MDGAAAFVSFMFSWVWRFLVSSASSGYLPWHLRPEPKSQGHVAEAGIEWSTGSETHEIPSLARPHRHPPH